MTRIEAVVRSTERPFLVDGAKRDVVGFGLDHPRSSDEPLLLGPPNGLNHFCAAAGGASAGDGGTGKGGRERKWPERPGRSASGDHHFLRIFTRARPGHLCGSTGPNLTYRMDNPPKTMAAIVPVVKKLEECSACPSIRTDLANLPRSLVRIPSSCRLPANPPSQGHHGTNMARKPALAGL